MTNEIKTFYDSLYADDPSVFGSSSVDFLRQVIDSFPVTTGAALDLGAGEGLTSNLLAERGFIVSAIDISESAFKSIKSDMGISTSIAPIEDFKANTEYSLVHIALVLHHVSEASAGSLIKSLKDHTVPGGIHILRLFTSNSDFFAQSNGAGFYDDGTNLDGLYDDWKILLDEKINATASTQSAQNEIRQVVFKNDSF